MNRSFAAGVATGMAVAVVGTLSILLLRPSGASAPDRRPARFRDVERRVEYLERELVSAREELRVERARVKELETFLQQIAPGEVPPPSAAPGLRPADRAGLPDGRRGTASGGAGGETPAEKPKDLANSAFEEDGKRVYGSLLAEYFSFEGSFTFGISR